MSQHPIDPDRPVREGVPAGPVVRPVQPADVEAIVAMVYELAEFERLRHECQLTAEQLREALFRPGAALFGHVAELDGAIVGMALWFLNYSTWAGVHGVYLEDLYVRPVARHSGAGRALLTALAQLCVERGYARLDWSVLDWNPARDFYARVGGRPMEAWIPYRLSGEALHGLAAGTPAGAVPDPVA